MFKHVILAHTAITDVCAKYTYIYLSIYTRKRRSVTRVRIANKSQALSILVAQMLRTVLAIRNTGYSSSMYISSIIKSYTDQPMELRNNWRERKLNFRARGVKPEK